MTPYLNTIYKHKTMYSNIVFKVVKIKANAWIHVIRPIGETGVFVLHGDLGVHSLIYWQDFQDNYSEVADV